MLTTQIQFLIYFLFKFVTFASFLLSTPLILENLGVIEFGVWSSISSFVTWVLVFDMGIANYFRNKVTLLASRGKLEELSREFGMVLGNSILLSVLVLSILLLLTFVIDWQWLLNTNYNARLAVILIVSLISVSFSSNLIIYYFLGCQKPHLSSALQACSHILFIACLYVLSSKGLLSLNILAMVFGMSFVLPGVVVTAWKVFKDKIKLSFKLHREMFNLGSKFFVIQLTGLILFSTDKLLFSNIFNPSVVTEYEIIYKILSIPFLIQGLLLGPAWGRISHFIAKEEIDELLIFFIKLILVCFLLICILIILSFYIEEVALFWLKSKISNYNFVLYVGFFLFLNIWNSLVAVFLNAANKLDNSFYICIVICIVNIPLSYYLAKSPLKEAGVVLGTIICMIPGAILGPWEIVNELNRLKNSKKIKS